MSGGQYHRPGGVQFGGTTASWSAVTLRRIWAVHLSGAAVVCHLDLHTGLGACGGQVVFQSADAGDQDAEIVADHFSDVIRTDRPETTDPVLSGVLGPALEATLGTHTLAMPLVVEFGTHEPVDVLTAMRADNWLHQHGDPTSELGRRIRAATRDAFFLDDLDWRAKVAEAGLATLHTALDVAADAARRGPSRGAGRVPAAGFKRR